MIISSAAISEAVNLCTLNNARFSDIGERCFAQLETSGLLGEMNSSDEADDLFLSLIQTELEDDNDAGFLRHQEVWTLAA
jgi:hypothetical protein